MSVELNDITSGYSTGLINNNFQLVEDELNNNVLRRQGLATGEANQMEIGLDMNSNFVFNLPEPVLEHQAARLQDVQNAIADNAANLITFTPYGNISSENIQGAIQELVDGTGQAITTATGDQTLVGALEQRGPVFDTVADMVSSATLTVGIRCKTLGYSSIGDGGGNYYEVVAAGTGTADGGTFIDLTGSSLQAKGLFLEDSVSTQQWGSGSKTFHVSTTGNDSNNGASSSPFLTISGALDYLLSLGSRLVGAFEIECAAGTYNEEVLIDRLASNWPLTIKGPDVGGHPNVPTCVISGAGITTGDAFRISGKSDIALRDIRVDGFTAGNGVNNGKSSRVSLTNFHTTNTRTAVANLENSFLSVRGGIWDGNNIVNSIGYSSFYNSTHDMTQASNNAATDALKIQNFDRGMLLNEGVQGHVDNVNILNCTEGLNIKRGAGAVNTKTMKIDGCATGVLVENNGWFNNGIVFGSISLNTVNVLPLGSSPEIAYHAQDNNAKTLRLLEKGNAASHTGTTSNTDLYETGNSPKWGLKTTQDIANIVIFGECSLTSSANVSIVIKNKSGTLVLISNVDVPSGATSFKVEFDVNHNSSSGTRTLSSVLTNVGVSSKYIEKTGLSLADGEFSFIIRSQLGASGDSIRFATILYNNTYGG